MREDLHNIDDLFRKAIEQHEDTPSAGVWENIDRSLDKKRVVFISKKYNKLKWVAAALLIFSAGMAMYTMKMRMKQNDVARQDNTRSGKNTDRRKYNELRKSSGEKSNAQTADAPKAANDSSIVALQKNENANPKKLDDNATAAGVETSVNQPGMMQKQSEKRVAALPAAIAKDIAAGKAVNGFMKNNKPVILQSRELIVNTAKAIHQGTNNNEIETVNERTNDFSFAPLPRDFLQNLESHITDKNSATSAFAAAKKVSKKGYHATRFSATVFFSPDVVSSTIKDDHRMFGEDDKNEIQRKEENGLSASMGVLLAYHFSRNWSVQSGLTFSNFVTNIHPKTLFARPDPDGHISYRFNSSSGYSFVDLASAGRPVFGDSVRALSSTNTLQYLSVPLAFQFHVGKGKWSVSPGMGVAANFLTKGKIETVIDGPNHAEKALLNHIHGLHPAYFNASLSLGAAYDITKTVAVSITPAARFALSSINSQAPVKTYLNSFGVAAGLSLKL